MIEKFKNHLKKNNNFVERVCEIVEITNRFFHRHYFAFRRTSKAEMLLHTPKPKDFLIQLIINYHVHGIFNYLSND